MDSSSSFVCYLIATGFDFFIKKENAFFKTEYSYFHLVNAVRMLGEGRHFPHAFEIPLECWIKHYGRYSALQSEGLRQRAFRAFWAQNFPELEVTF